MENINAVQTVNDLREIIQFAPKATATAKGLLGWWTPDGFYICASCASRVFGRGCALPKGSEASWENQPFGVCLNCESEGVR